MLNKLFTSRLGFLLGFIAGFGLVALAIFIQTQNNLEPCPLCISQRIVYMVFGIIALVAGLHNPKTWLRKAYAGLMLLTTFVGMGVAARHIWIQANPDKVMAECGAGFDYIFQTFPFKKALDLVFKGTGECSTVDWTLFGMTIPQLSMVFYVALAMYSLMLLRAKVR